MNETNDYKAEGNQVFEQLRGLPQILLASGQTLPNVLAMRELGSREYMILRTKDVFPDRLRAACASFGFEELAPPVLIESHDALVTERVVRAAFDGLMQQRPETRWVVNLTGSTKLATLGTALALGVPGTYAQGLAGAVYYDKGIYAMVPGGECMSFQPISRPLSVEEALRANGLMPVPTRGLPAPVTNVFTFSIKANPSPEDIKVAREIARDPDRFDTIGDVRQGKSELSPQDVQTLAARYVKESQGEGHLGKKPGDYFNGLWLECLLYDVLSRSRDELKIDDVQMGVVLHRTNQNNDPDTDLDVCFTYQNVLHFISCKTDKVEKMLDEVYEVAVRRQQAGGTFGAAGLMHWCELDRLGDKNLAHAKRAQKAAEQLKIALLLGDSLHSKQVLMTALRRFVETAQRRA